jgi:hypothetical protein
MLLKLLHFQKKKVEHNSMEFQTILFPKLLILLTLIKHLNSILDHLTNLNLNYQSDLLFRFKLYYFSDLLHLNLL